MTCFRTNLSLEREREGEEKSQDGGKEKNERKIRWKEAVNKRVVRGRKIRDKRRKKMKRKGKNQGMKKSERREEMIKGNSQEWKRIGKRIS